MDPRKIGVWMRRLVVSAGIVAAFALGAAGVAQAAEVSNAGSDSAVVVSMDPGWA